MMVREVECLATSEGDLGFVVYGPYESYPAGRYVATFRVALAGEARDNTACCALDVAANGALKILGRALIYPSYLGCELRTFDVPFEIADTNTLEFRVRALGHAPILVDCERVVKSVKPTVAQYAPMLPANVEEPPTFFAAHVGRFRALFDQGVRFEIENGRVIARYQDLRLSIENEQDFQLLVEIYVKHEYNFVTGLRVCVIDVGMNVGLTSLFLASRPYVEEVHGFEPFTAPFGRAQVNASLNPEVAHKISMNNFGLSDFDGEQTVCVDPKETIGTSIRGVGDGEVVTIQIRDAASVLGPTIERATSRGMEVFAKIDCEGSEFAIIKSLRNAGLLKSVTAMAVEWHKWWDFRKTQNDLFASLLPEGFVIFDLTAASNPDAGFFYAVRKGSLNLS
jgi:FkbM family methyltransferase